MKPPRSKTTLSIFFALARSAIALPTTFRAGAIGHRFVLSENGFFRRGRGDQSFPRVIIDHLRINMLPGKMDAETRPFRRADDFLPDSFMNAVPNRFAIDSHGY